MKYIVAQEKNNYGAWQCTILVQSLVDLGVKVQDIYILLGDFGYNKDWNNFNTRFLGINIHAYRNHCDKSYKPSIKPYLLYHFFKEFNFLSKEQWCLLDNDVIITKKFRKKKKGKVYLSDCSGYINLDYLEKKGLGLAEGMAKELGIPYSVIVENDSGAGGAQYIFDNIDWKVWYRAYLNSLKLHAYLSINRDTFYRDSKENCIQTWCSEMWAVLWSIWEGGHKTVIDEDMKFLFATDPIDAIDKHKVIHNAGVMESDTELFNKGHFYNKSPKKSQLIIDNTKVSSLYYDYLKKVL